MRQHWPDLGSPILVDRNEGSHVSLQERPDLVILYGLPPEADIYDTLEDIRIFSDVPIVVAAEHWEETDIAKALEMGADRYIRLPCGTEQILARVVALFRRAGVA